MLEGMEKESRAIREEALRMTWWMRGGLSYEDALMLTTSEKEAMNEIIKDNKKKTLEKKYDKIIKDIQDDIEGDE